MSRITKIIKGKTGYFVQREGAKLIYDPKTRQQAFKCEVMSFKNLAAELKDQFEDGYPINADDKVLKELAKAFEK